MAKAVFATKIVPAYDDLPEVRYHFPHTYLSRVEQAVGDWIVYYEPGRTGAGSQRGGRLSYFATARIQRIERDPAKDKHYYAFVDNYLEFDRAVPFKDGQHYYESALRREDGTTETQSFRNAVRIISNAEYDLILQSGFTKTLEIMQPRPDLRQEQVMGFAEEAIEFGRPIIERVVARPFRDAAFAVAIKEAYSDTCAMTGLKIINGGGRAEVQAAHIRPVADHGPDSLRNGLALSGTAHWMFDRGLISIDDDFSILVAKDRLPDTALRLLNENQRLILPQREDMKPHPRYLGFHRENIFKG